MEKNDLPIEMLEILARQFAALADVNRLRIVQRLQRGQATVTALAEELAISQPNTSAHLAVLRNAGLVAAQRQGRTVVYGLADATTTSLCEILCARVRERQGQLASALGLRGRRRSSTSPSTAGRHTKSADRIRKEK